MWTKHIGVRVFISEMITNKDIFFQFWLICMGWKTKPKMSLFEMCEYDQYNERWICTNIFRSVYQYQVYLQFLVSKIILQTMLENEGVRQPFIYLSFCWSFYNENYQEKAWSSFGCQHYTPHNMDQMATPWIRVNAIPPCWRIILKWLAWRYVYSVWILSCHNIAEQMST